MAFASREQAASLLSAAKNHADLAVKVSSLKQAKEILLSLDPSVAADLFPHVVELQKSPEIFVRKCLVEVTLIVRRPCKKTKKLSSQCTLP